MALVAFGIAACSFGPDMTSTPPPKQIRSVNLYLEPLSATLIAGDTVDVAVLFDATATRVAAAQAYLNFDPAVLQVIDDNGSPATRVTPGSLFAAADWRILQNEVDNSTGQVNFAGGKKPLTGTDVTGNARFATLKFRALKPVSNTSVNFNPPDSGNLRQTKAASGYQDVTRNLDGLTLSISPANTSGRPPAIGKMYVQKWLLGNEPPENLIVTIPDSNSSKMVLESIERPGAFNP